MHLSGLAKRGLFMLLPDIEIWLDNQLPSHLAKWITEAYGWTVRSAYILQIKTAGDWEIYTMAKASDKLIVIISKDGDFSKIIEQNGTPPKLIKLNTGNMPSRMLWNLLKPLLPEALDLLMTTAQIVFIESQENKQ